MDGFQLRRLQDPVQSVRAAPTRTGALTIVRGLPTGIRAGGAVPSAALAAPPHAPAIPVYPASLPYEVERRRGCGSASAVVDFDAAAGCINDSIDAEIDPRRSGRASTGRSPFGVAADERAVSSSERRRTGSASSPSAPGVPRPCPPPPPPRRATPAAYQCLPLRGPHHSHRQRRGQVPCGPFSVGGRPRRGAPGARPQGIRTGNATAAAAGVSERRCRLRFIERRVVPSSVPALCVGKRATSSRRETPEKGCPARPAHSALPQQFQLLGPTEQGTSDHLLSSVLCPGQETHEVRGAAKRGEGDAAGEWVGARERGQGGGNKQNKDGKRVARRLTLVSPQPYPPPAHTW